MYKDKGLYAHCRLCSRLYYELDVAVQEALVLVVVVKGMHGSCSSNSWSLAVLMELLRGLVIATAALLLLIAVVVVVATITVV
jgi:hypothetical protein